MRKSLHSLLGLAVLASAVSSASAAGQTAGSLSSAWREDFMPCFQEAAQRYGLNEYLLKAIALHESNMNPHANNTANFDDSEDIGIMQVNSWWLSNELHKYGINRERLWNPCLNIHTGAWILAQEVQKYGHGWKAIGYYNARTDWKRERYIGQIKRSLSRVYAAYGIVNVDAMNPAVPVNATPTKNAVFKQQNPWAVSPRAAAKPKATPSVKPRRIIVVTSEHPQERS